MTVLSVDKDGKESTVSISGQETTNFAQWAQISVNDSVTLSKALSVGVEDMKLVKNRIWTLSDESSLSTTEKDKKSITITEVTKLGPVRNMVWMLFSLFPAAIVVIMMGLLYLYPIKK